MARWVRKRKEGPLFESANEEIQIFFRRIADHVQKNYEPAHAAYFLGGADPWVIAHAKVSNAILVTNEKRVSPGAKKVKIPNICDVFNVVPYKLDDLFRDLKPPFLQ